MEAFFRGTKQLTVPSIQSGCAVTPDRGQMNIMYGCGPATKKPVKPAMLVNDLNTCVYLVRVVWNSWSSKFVSSENWELKSAFAFLVPDLFVKLDVLMN